MDDQDNREHPEGAKVGYCSPPRNSRFKKGQSGNPKGRPKGSLNLATVLERTLREKVVINKRGARKTVTKLERAVEQLVNKAAEGDLQAMRHLSALASSAEIGAETTQDKANLAEADQRIVQRLLEKLQGIPEEGDDGADK